MRFKGVTSIISIALILSGRLFAATPSSENCHYYLDKEKEVSCYFKESDESDYFVKYGYKYCALFHSKLKAWADERGQWVKKTAICLQSEIENVPTSKKCPVLEDAAWDSHPGCYRKSGFCGLTTSQKTAVVWAAIGFDTILNPKRSLYQAFSLLGDCLKEIPTETAAIRNRLRSGTLSPHLKSKVISVLDVDRLLAPEQKQYAREALRYLLGGNKIKSSGLDAYIAIYGKTDQVNVSLSEIKARCIVGNKVQSDDCKNLEKVIGSRIKIENLQEIPNEIREEDVDNLLRYKKELEANKMYAGK